MDHRRFAALCGVLLATACDAASHAPAPGPSASAPEPPARRGLVAHNLLAWPRSEALQLASTGRTVLAVWIEPRGGMTVGGGRSYQLRFARFEAGRWSTPTTIALSDSIVANWADVPSVAAAGDGTLVAHWAERSGSGSYAYDVVLARSTDGGASWTRIGKAHDDATATEHGFVSLVGEDAAVRAFWLDGRDTAAEGHEAHGGAMTLRTALVDQSVAAGERLDARVCDCCGTAAARTAEGAVLVYRDRAEDETRDIAIVRQVGGRFGEPRKVHDDGWVVPGCPVNGPAVAAAERRLAVAWYSYAGEAPRVLCAFSSDAGASFGPPVLVDAARGRRAPLGRVDVALTGDGAAVSWLASDREDATLLVRRVSPDGRVGEPTTIARTKASREAGFPRMERLDDELFVGWTEPADAAGQPSLVRTASLAIAELGSPVAPITASGQAAGLVRAGASAPDYGARTLDGQATSLASLRGKVVLLNLWATWCEPCRQELPELGKLHERFGKKGLAVVGVSLDREATPDDIRRFVERRKVPYAVWHDREDRASAAFGVTTLPASVLVDRRGRIAWSRAGTLTAGDESLGRAIDAALGAR